MKQIKFLLLILMALVTQGAWGQDAQAPRPKGSGFKNDPFIISVGDWTVTLPSLQEISLSDWQALTSIGSYTIFKLEAPRAGTLQIISNAGKAIQYALFDENMSHLEHAGTSQIMEFNSDIESGKTYYIGMRAMRVTDALLTVKLFCKNHMNTEVIPCSVTCTEDGMIEHILCRDCGGRFTNDEEHYPLYEWNIYQNALGHDIKDGGCTRCDLEFYSLKLDGNNSCQADFNNNYVYEYDNCTVYRVMTPSDNWHGEIVVTGTYTSDWAGIRLIDKYTFENVSKKPIYNAPRRTAENNEEEDQVGYFEECGTIAFSPYIYVVLYHEGEGKANLTFEFISHEQNVTQLQAMVEANGCKDGHHALYQCTHERCGGEWPSTYFTEEGIYFNFLNELDLVIPGEEHSLNDKGTCTFCGQKPVLDDGTNAAKFFAGSQVITAFKYTATESGYLNVVVETDADIDNYTIMPWSQWENGNNDDKYKSAPRRANAKNTLTMSKKVVEGEKYAILFITSSEAEVDASITISYSEPVYQEVKVGNNDIYIDEIIGDRDYNSDCFNLFKFVAPASGSAHFYTQGYSDTFGMLFSSDLSEIDRDDDGGDGGNFRIDCEVVEGNIYYIGVRQYSGYSIEEYPLVIEIEGYTPPVELMPFELVTEDSEGTVTELPLYDVYYDFFNKLEEWESDSYFDEEDNLVFPYVTYKRNATTFQWGTVVLPYDLQSDENVQYYELSSVSDDNLTFVPVNEVEANTPTFYKLKTVNENGKYQYDASTSVPTTVILNGNYPSCEPIEDWRLWGYYVKYVIDSTKKVEQGDSNYWPTIDGVDYCIDVEAVDELARTLYISGDKFHYATTKLTINPYRAALYYNGDSTLTQQVKSIRIADDEGTTEINAIITEDGIEEVEAIYDLNGRKQSKMNKGVNIIRTADGKTHKIINK